MKTRRVASLAGVAAVLIALLVPTAAHAEDPSDDFSDIAAYGATLESLEHPYIASENPGSDSLDGPIVTPLGGFATSPVGSFSWSWNGITINVPVGCFLNMTVQGTGLQLTGTIAGVDCIGPAAIIPGMFCNWSGVYRFVNASGVEYARQTTAVQAGCGQASFYIPGASPRTMQTGSICLDFRNNGTVRGTTCLAVFP